MKIVYLVSAMVAIMAATLLSGCATTTALANQEDISVVGLRSALRSLDAAYIGVPEPTRVERTATVVRERDEVNYLESLPKALSEGDLYEDLPQNTSVIQQTSTQTEINPIWMEQNTIAMQWDNQELKWADRSLEREQMHLEAAQEAAELRAREREQARRDYLRRQEQKAREEQIRRREQERRRENTLDYIRDVNRDIQRALERAREQAQQNRSPRVVRY